VYNVIPNMHKALIKGALLELFAGIMVFAMDVMACGLSLLAELMADQVDEMIMRVMFR
jgi:hypothetical protein